VTFGPGPDITMPVVGWTLECDTVKYCPVGGGRDIVLRTHFAGSLPGQMPVGTVGHSGLPSPFRIDAAIRDLLMRQAPRPPAGWYGDGTGAGDDLLSPMPGIARCGRALQFSGWNCRGGQNISGTAITTDGC
jgi:hypothetical protein